MPEHFLQGQTTVPKPQSYTSSVAITCIACKKIGGIRQKAAGNRGLMIRKIEIVLHVCTMQHRYIPSYNELCQTVLFFFILQTCFPAFYLQILYIPQTFSCTCRVKISILSLGLLNCSQMVVGSQSLCEFGWKSNRLSPMSQFYMYRLQ